MSITYGSWTTLTVTNLQSLASDATDVYSGWKSDVVDNPTAVKADDYEVIFKLPTTTAAITGDLAAYVYVLPWMYDGAAWQPGGNGGTTAAHTTAESTFNISDPNAMRGPYPIPIKIAGQVMQGYLQLGQFCRSMPDGWQLAIRQNTGAAFTTGCSVAYRSINYTS